MGTQAKCQPGDIALVVTAKNAENVGQVVEVLAVATGEPFKLSGRGHVWQVKCPGSLAGLLYAYEDGRRIALNEGPVPDECLHPLRATPRSCVAAKHFSLASEDELVITICPRQQ